MFKFVTPQAFNYSILEAKKLRDILEKKNLRVHNLVIAKGDKIFFHVHTNIYPLLKKHRMYSETKSLVSLGIGLLYDDKKIKLNDPLSKYFQEYVDENTDKILLNQTIEDTLKMGTCVTSENWFKSPIKDRVELYFKQKHNRNCLERFEYDSAGSMVLSALVEKVAKQDLFSFLYERIFKYLDYFKDAHILKIYNDMSWGDSGMICSVLAMASLGKLFLNKGVINGKRLISEDYLRKATTKYLDTSNEKMKCKRYGYGYQIWMVKDGYAFLGMGNQMTIIYPSKDVVISMVGNSFDKNHFARDVIFTSLHHFIFSKQSAQRRNIKINHQIKLFQNVIINNKIIDNYANNTYFCDNSFIKSFKIIGNQNSYNLIFSIEDKVFKIPFKKKETTKTKITDIFSKERIVKLPQYDIYDLYCGLEKCTNKSLLFQGQIIGDYLATINLKIIFNKNGLNLKLITHAENFLEKYNGSYYFKLR